MDLQGAQTWAQASQEDAGKGADDSKGDVHT